METLQTVFLVGTGSEEGAWPPIARAINEFWPPARIDPTSDRVAEESAFWLAQQVIEHRLLYSPQEPKDANKGLAHLSYELKRAIARHLDNAIKSDELRLRERFVVLAPALCR